MRDKKKRLASGGKPLQPEDHLSGGGSGSLIGYLWRFI